MYVLSALVPLLPALAWLPTATCATQSSSKRGLVFTPNEDWPEDDYLWGKEESGLKWYYNFGPEVSAPYKTIAQDKFEFVPMQWGSWSENGTDSYFAGNISETIDKDKRDITHVMTFNHPDSSFDNGGSEMSPRVAAQSWINNAIPLQERGIKVGLPIVGDPYSWVTPFLKNCTALLEKKQQKRQKDDDKKPTCKFDFMPITSYGNMTVLKDRVELFATAYPGIPVWLVEYGFNDQDLDITQKFFNESLVYLEEAKSVERYAWFGAFRSVVSNVGPNAAMLGPYGDLTDIGNWYLGKQAVQPEVEGEPVCSASNPCGGKNSGMSLTASGGLVLGPTVLLAWLFTFLL